MLAAQSCQLRFCFLTGFDVGEIRQSVPESADDGDMTGPDLATALRLGGGR